MDRPTLVRATVSRALIAGSLVLCAQTALAQAVAASVPAAVSVSVPASTSIAPPVSTSVAAPVSTSVSLPVSTSVSLPVSTSVAPPVASSVSPAAASSIELPAAATVAAPAEGDARTSAESDYDALYGVDATSANDDGSLPAPADLPQAYDPWEPFNRKMHSFNNVVDAHVAKPLAKFYMAVLPRPVRLGVSNFFANLGQPLTMINALLQGKPKEAAQALGRFAVNSTLGIGGIFDPATEAKIPHNQEDFGQTLGVWGWKRSRYIELPLFGPRTVRDMFGMASDAPFGLTRQVDNDTVRWFLQGLNLVDVRTQLMSVDAMREGATDDYTLVRDAWLQRREYQIFGDRKTDADDTLPDYLRDDSNPDVPIDAIPITPMDSGR
jgi:phospholipid-binding lipoprotein MlaA